MGRSLSLCPSCCIKQGPGQLGLHSQSLSQKTKTKKLNENLFIFMCVGVLPAFMSVYIKLCLHMPDMKLESQAAVSAGN